MTGDIDNKYGIPGYNEAHGTVTVNPVFDDISFEFLDISDFHAKFGPPPPGRPMMLTQRQMQDRVNFLFEELRETVDAYNENKLEKVVDGLVDLVYVALGTAWQMGLDWPKHWAAVHKANMQKEPGMTKRGMAYDAVKPEGWTPPDHRTILITSGCPEGEVDDRSCYSLTPVVKEP